MASDGEKQWTAWDNGPTNPSSGSQGNNAQRWTGKLGLHHEPAGFRLRAQTGGTSHLASRGPKHSDLFNSSLVQTSKAVPKRPSRIQRQSWGSAVRSGIAWHKIQLHLVCPAGAAHGVSLQSQELVLKGKLATPL